MEIVSPAFDNEHHIPREYTADGRGAMPSLVISGVPQEAVSLVLICNDPDVPRERKPDGNFDHWVVWNLSPGTTSILAEDDHDGVVGVGTTGQNRWIPPSPPLGTGAHRYFFTLYAIDTTLALPASSGRHAVEEAITGHVIATAQLMGRYSRD